jgi:hypothetical protein
MMMDSDNVSFMLSREELFYCLRLLQLQNIPGLGEEPFGKIDDADLEKIMEAAYRALIARQTLIFEADKGFRLDKVVSTTLSVCSAPEKMIVTTFQLQQEPIRVIHEYFAKDLTVKQEIPLNGVFQFDLREANDANPDSALDAVKNVPDVINIGVSSGFSFEITGSEFEDFRQKLTTSIDEAQMLLVEQKIKPKQASELINIFSSPDFRLTLQFFFTSMPPMEVGQRVLSVAAAKGIWCLIQGDGLSTDKLKIQKTTKVEICKAIETTYTKLFAVEA